MSRQLVLVIAIFVLLAALAYRVMMVRPEHHEPATHGTAGPVERLANNGTEPHASGPSPAPAVEGALPGRSGVRYAYDERAIIPLGMSRAPESAGSGLVTVFIGTNVREAFDLRVRAESALQAGDAAQADELARQGLALDPDYPQLLVVAVVAELARGDDWLADAERFARHAVEVSPQFPEAHYNLACVLARLGRAWEAAAALRETLLRMDEQRAAVIERIRDDADFDRIRSSEDLRAVLSGE